MLGGLHLLLVMIHHIRISAYFYFYRQYLQNTMQDRLPFNIDRD